MDASPVYKAPARTIELLRFVGRIYRMRMLGLGTGVLAVAGVLHQNGASLSAWIALAANGYVWPHVAYLLARRSRDPERAEFRNLAVDSACGAVWIAMMQFNLLPCALLAVMLSADKIGVGGWRFLSRTAALQAAACALTAFLLGFPFRPNTTMLNIAWSLPFMLVYPLAISTAAYALGRKVVRQNRLLARLNHTDVLTGLWNRLHWEDTTGTELSRCIRTSRPAVLLLMDIDHFKDVNDVHGHPVGDAVLRRIAAILRSSLREIDMPARFGGDEFGAVLTETTLGDAIDAAERIRAIVEAARFDGVPDLHCTVSIGLAAADPACDDAATWVRRADIALYRGKQLGRNRVAIEEIPASEASAASPQGAKPAPRLTSVGDR